MERADGMDMNELGQAFALVGNLLLSPMSQIGDQGVDASFWRAVPTLGDEAADEAARAMAGWCESADWSRFESLVQMVSVEYTRLFIGPPEPAAAPWETMYALGGAACGFGEPTFQMRELLREAGLELGGGNRQYEDHMGVELLLLSELCGTGGARKFAEEHPRAWIGPFSERVSAAAPDGYYRLLLAYAARLLDLV